MGLISALDNLFPDSIHSEESDFDQAGSEVFMARTEDVFDITHAS